MKKQRRIHVIALVLVLLMTFVACKSKVCIIEQTQKHNYVEPPYVDYSLTDIPEFVNDISECIDTKKQYVLPDGYLYGYEPIPVISVVNQLQVSTDIDGSVFNECGYLDNARIRGILEIGEWTYGFITGFIPISKGDIIYFNGNCFDPEFQEAHVMNIAFYNADKQAVAKVEMISATDGYFDIVETNHDGYVSALRVSESIAAEDVSYIRLSLIGSGHNQIISVNEPLIPTYETSDWIRIDKYFEENWCKEIQSTIETINTIDITDKSTAIKFMFASDIHLRPDSTTSYTENLGKVCAEVMSECDISFFVSGGDNCTQSSEFMPTIFKENMMGVLKQLLPIPPKNILLTVGNHDGETGACEYNGEMVYYRFQLNNEERSSVFFDWQRETNEYKRFDSDGTYYYIDDSDTKTRYILLNSFWSIWEGEENGFVPDIQHSFGHSPHFGSQQLKWFAEEALDMPPNYGAIIVTHFAPDARDFEVFKGIVDAFSNKLIYKGSYVGVEDWQSTDIAVNYENAYGEIIAVFQGHRHTDALYDYFENVPCINITTAGAFWAVRDEYDIQRVPGTDTEFAVDAVVIDRAVRKIYLTRLGAGYDRVIEY